MSDGRGGWGRKLVGVLVVLAVLTALGAAGLYFIRANAGPSKTDTETTSFDEKVTKLDFSGEDADVSISVGDSVEVTKKLTWRGDDKPSITEKVSGQTLKIQHQHCGDLEFLHPNGCSASYDITVPADTKLDLDADSGDVTTSGFAGDQSIAVDSGDVDISEATGNLKVDGNSGDVTGDELGGARADIHQDSGDVKLEYVKAPEQIKTNTDSGGFFLTVPDDKKSYQVDAQVNSGDENISLPESKHASRSITASIDSGDLELKT